VLFCHLLGSLDYYHLNTVITFWFEELLLYDLFCCKFLFLRLQQSIHYVNGYIDASWRPVVYQCFRDACCLYQGDHPHSTTLHGASTQKSHLHTCHHKNLESQQTDIVPKFLSDVTVLNMWIIFNMSKLFSTFSCYASHIHWSDTKTVFYVDLNVSDKH
jgi:hypothetical protein